MSIYRTPPPLSRQDKIRLKNEKKGWYCLQKKRSPISNLFCKCYVYSKELVFRYSMQDLILGSLFQKQLQSSEKEFFTFAFFPMYAIYEMMRRYHHIPFFISTLRSSLTLTRGFKIRQERARCRPPSALKNRFLNVSLKNNSLLIAKCKQNKYFLANVVFHYLFIKKLLVMSFHNANRI